MSVTTVAHRPEFGSGFFGRFMEVKTPLGQNTECFMTSLIVDLVLIIYIDGKYSTGGSVDSV